MSVNKAILVGRLGRDPEGRYTQSGTPVCNLSIATTRRVKNKATDQWEEETEWHRVSVFGKTADACTTYLAKGREVYVEGRIRTRSYEDKDGVKRYSTEVVADVVQFLGGKDGGGQSGGGGYGGGKRGGPEPYDPGDYGSGRRDDDIPF